MSEFKGTKGKWTYEYDGDGMRFSEISCFIDDTYENYKEDALLISKAPEMLEMLKKAKSELSRIKGSMMAHPDCTEGSEFDDYTNSAEEVEKELEQLIKEATEL